MKTLIVGAGPRSLILAERLISNYEQQPHPKSLSIQLVDPYGIGGRVWRRNQNPLFLMNSAIQQLTFFTDDAVVMDGPVHNGPNFYEWTQTQASTYLAKQVATNHDEQAAYFKAHLADLQENGYPSRALLNYYASWYYEQLVSQAQALAIDLTVTIATVLDIEQAPTAANPRYHVITDAGSFNADEIVMALGHADNTPSPEEAQLAAFAEFNNLTYIGAQHPAEADLSAIPAGEDVLIRGLGLNFFDYMIQLTLHRGGQFQQQADGSLKYLPSGYEPHLIAGSRSGLPMHAKGVNQKTQGTRYKPHFLTAAKLAELTANGTQTVPFETFKQLFVAEMEYVYYVNLAKERHLDYTTFATALLASTDLAETARDFGIPEADIFSLERVLHPLADMQTTTNYQSEMRAYLMADIADASKGNLDAPFTAAFDLIRDIRDVIRILIEGNGFNNDDRKRFLTEFNALSSLISVGPPKLRIEQMVALMDAGILDLLPAGLTVHTIDGQFVATTNNPHYTVTVNNLVEARLGAINLHQSTNPLEVALRDRGEMTSASYMLANGTVYSTGALLVDRGTFELIAGDGTRIPGIRAYGVPTEKYMWFTTSLPRPYGNDRMLRDADHIARLLLDLK